MKPNTMVGTVIVFGLLVAFVTPHITEIFFRNSDTYSLNNNELASNQIVNVEKQTAEETTEIDLAVAEPIIEETKKEEVKTTSESTATPQIETKTEEQENTVYEGLTLKQLADKLNKNLNSSLSGTGIYFAKYAIEYGVDPYLVTAIALHETGCKWKCSTNVTQCNNVGGMKGGTQKCNNTSYAAFDSLETGISSFIYNIKTNYWDKGLTTAQAMNSKYASSSSWSEKVNNYINIIRNS